MNNQKKLGMGFCTQVQIPLTPAIGVKWGAICKVMKTIDNALSAVSAMGHDEKAVLAYRCISLEEGSKVARLMFYWARSDDVLEELEKPDA